MRTTLTLDDDVIELAKKHAARRQMSLGQAVSELVRKGAERPLALDEVNGLQVARLPDDSPRITPERVTQLLEEIE